MSEEHEKTNNNKTRKIGLFIKKALKNKRTNVKKIVEKYFFKISQSYF